ncbi:MAG TPA: hypothetical protein DHU55_04045 [Blastocatellia bacterium]|nr:hypothetical protein [Blastocatellia bacterium]
MRKTPMRGLAIIAAAMIVAALPGELVASSAQSRVPMAPADILRVVNVSDAQISPNGQWVVYSVSRVEGNETVSSLWLARAELDYADLVQPSSPPNAQRRHQPDVPIGSTSTPLLPLGWNASNARWSPDNSKIAFLGTRDERGGIWVIDLDKREPRFIASVVNTNFFITYAGESLAWAPDSRRLAYISATEELSGSRDSETPDDPRVVDRIQYKSRTSFSDNRRTHVWITAIDRPEPRQLTSGPFYDHAITFNPNGNEIAFLSNREQDPEANNNSDIFAVDLHGETRQITQTKGCEYEPTWSPDGKWIAYTATKRDVTTIDSVAEDTHVWVIASSGGAGREVSGKLDRRARSPRWTSEGRRILFLAADQGRTLIYSTELEDANNINPVFDVSFFPQFVPDAPAETRRGRIQFTSFTVSVSRDRQPLLAFTLSDPLSLPEIWLGQVRGLDEKLRRVSHHNDVLLSNLTISEPEPLSFKSFDGTPIQGWLIKPVGWRPDRKYPLILSIHGGPHGMYGWIFNPTFQVYAARGYAVLYLNPRGSSGYGQKFSDGTLNEWGGGDYKDLMAGVDEALRRYSWIDPDRMGVTGGSYGGFMTNWIITQTPRFRAAVSSASVSNLISFYSTSLYQDLIHAEFGGFPWDNYDLLWQWSPLRYVKQAQTPTLFIHGEQDNDVHITQAEEMYMALKRRGVETVLVRYPREGHGLREPRHRVDALERTLAWFDRFLK